MANDQEEINIYGSIAKLMAILRLNTNNNQSSLAVECLMHIAIRPRSYEELTILTGAPNSSINRAIAKLVPRSDGETIIKPTMHLLNREIRPAPLQGYLLSLSKGGQMLLKQAGLNESFVTRV